MLLTIFIILLVLAIIFLLITLEWNSLFTGSMTIILCNKVACIYIKDKTIKSCNCYTITITKEGKCNRYVKHHKSNLKKEV